MRKIKYNMKIIILIICIFFYSCSTTWEVIDIQPGSTPQTKKIKMVKIPDKKKTMILETQACDNKGNKVKVPSLVKANKKTIKKVLRWKYQSILIIEGL